MQTGYYVDNSNYIYGPQRAGQFYILGNRIYGPATQGIYYVDSYGNICGPKGTTGFMIRSGYIYGPSSQLPWF